MNITMSEASILISAVALLTSVGLTGWVYKVMNTRIEFLKEDIDKIKRSETRWMQKYKQLLAIIMNNKKCSNGSKCNVYAEYIRLTDEEGIL